MARKDDEIDILLRRWAQVKRQMLGLAPMDGATASEFVGAIRCTLSAVKDHHDGAASGTAMGQHYPEVFKGLSFDVNMAVHGMRRELRDVTVAHYVAHGPVKLKADALAISPPEYWNRIDAAKAFIDAWVKRGMSRDLSRVNA